MIAIILCTMANVLSEFECDCECLFSGERPLVPTSSENSDAGSSAAFGVQREVMDNQNVSVAAIQVDTADHGSGTELQLSTRFI
jgi:hypothetical protein